MLVASLFASIIMQAACVTGSTPTKPAYLREQGDFFMQAGITSFNQYNLMLATQQFSQAKAFYSRYEDHIGITNSLLNLAQTNIASGDFDDATAHLDSARLLIERYQLAQQALVHAALLSSLQLSTGNLITAKITLNQFDTELHNADINADLLALLINRTRLAQLSVEDFSIWMALLNRYYTNHSSDALQARVQRFQGWQAMQKNDSQTGGQLFSAALNYYRAAANPNGLMSTHLEWADACSSLNLYEPAAQHYELALYTAIANHHIPNGMLALDGLRKLYSRTNETDKMRQVDDWALQLKSLPADSTIR